MKKYLFILLAIAFLLPGCELNEEPVSTIDKNSVFSSEEGLSAYSMSFYEIFPSPTVQGAIEGGYEGFGAIPTDYCAAQSILPFVLLNGVSENTSTGWNWANLRNLNYFIVNCTNPDVPEEVRNNYIGLARFFRAWFYFDKVKTFGDVPWIDRPLDPQDEDILYGSRDSRELVMEKVYEDLMFAAQNITRTIDATQCTYVTKWAVLAFASRVALFEGTFRKYHNLNLATSADTWLKRAEDAAYEVMQNSGKRLNPSYRELFTSNNPPTTETILAITGSESLGIMHSTNWYWSTGITVTTHFIRPFVCTYLQKDGTPYTDRPGWQYEDFYEEFQNRDERLSATLRYPGYKREGNLALPLLNGIGRLGYQMYKLCVDATAPDAAQLSTHALQVIRYGEVLLNYAEAKAELGTLTNDDWSKTIGALRARAGITGGLTSKPAVIDNYLKNTYYPNVSDPVILEIRRERGIELSFEGFRFDDVRRWKCGDLFKMSWTGMYIPFINLPLDIDHDGTHDVIYYTDEAELAKADALCNNPNVYKVAVSTNPDSPLLQVHPAGDGVGYYLAWRTNEDHLKVWGSKQYLYPIPRAALNLNPNLGQNPGWENGATNDGN
ncbi:RagB/SusD family nutrient uptake outer membrane protein [Parabacteroides gordonii]|uniref:RagB/SusD family nutrient uptake outer membrane protein n=1 Tax=Parabacteroides gordonii TaxID=574930 RepID=UPI0026F1E74E|nr:RagB/SusD family nutrient uptake outer membrane protein [Parabacteroides gordonii]